MTFKSVAREAADIVAGDRHLDYGDAYRECKRVAKLWSVIAETPITPEQVGLMMIALKITREMNRSKRDNRVDIAGYAEVLEVISHGRQMDRMEHKQVDLCRGSTSIRAESSLDDETEGAEQVLAKWRTEGTL